MKKIIFLLLANLLFSCFPDDGCNNDIFIKNETENTIWLAFEERESSSVSCGSTDFTRIESNVTFKFSNDPTNNNGRCWEEDIVRVYDGALVIYLFLEEPQLTLGDDCDQELLNLQVIERGEYTIEDLEELNWEIVYP